MANVTIPNLTSATSITPSSDLLVVEQTNGTRKATASQLFTSSATSGSALGITSGGVYTIKSGLDSDISDINTLLGNTSIASIGDGTVTGAVSQINSELSAKLDASKLSFTNVQSVNFSEDVNTGDIGMTYIITPNDWVLLTFDMSISRISLSVTHDAGHTWQEIWIK